jgi:predicted DNA-binding transcriptional regulator YafY
MPQVKQPHYRFLIIDRLLFHIDESKRQYCTLLDFVEEMRKQDLKVSLRTVERDIATMRKNTQLGYNAEIKYCRKKQAYYYKVPGYTIAKIALTDDQLQLLEIASGIMKKFKGMSTFSEMDKVVDKLSEAIIQLKKPQTKRSNSFILLEEAPHQEGLQHLEGLMWAIFNKQPLKIQYNAFGKENKEHHFHPYFLKQYKQRWYLTGSAENKPVIYHLALDRIRKVEELVVEFKPCPISNPDDYYKDIIGISYPESSPEKIILSFAPTQGNYIKTQYLHKSQEILVDNDQELRIALHLFPNYEFISCLMSYGPDVKVLEPESLKIKVRELYRKALEGYEEL